MKNFLLGMITIIIFFLLGVAVSQAATAETTVTVVIQDEVSSSSTINVSASVPCNEINCAEPVEEQSLWSKITNWFKNLF